MFNLICRSLAPCRLYCNNQEDRDAAEHVKPVEAGNDEEAGCELRHTPGVVRQSSAFSDQMAPLQDLATLADSAVEATPLPPITVDFLESSNADEW